MKPKQIDLGLTLYVLRQFHGMSQADVMEHVDVKPSHMSELEKNIKLPSWETLQQFLEFYGISHTAFFMIAEGLAGAKLPVRSDATGRSAETKLARQVLDWRKTVNQQSARLQRKKEAEDAEDAETNEAGNPLL